MTFSEKQIETARPPQEASPVEGIEKIHLPCRSCGCLDAELVLDLGVQPLANNLLRPADLEKPEPRFPLRLAVCCSCRLLQITDLVPPVDLFSDYPYFSSFSDFMVRHAGEAANRYTREFALDENSLVAEVASNDGYLLKNFLAAKVPCLGIEPAANIAAVAREQGIETLVEFFGENLAAKLASSGREADLILGNNVFAHAPDTNDFVKGLGRFLKPEGRIVLEFPYAADFIENTEFDTIYHEHVFYFSLSALRPLFERHGLSIFHVERLPIHGGSLRIFAGHKGAHAEQPRVGALLEEERDKGMHQAAYYEGFAKRAHELKRELTELLEDLKREERSIAAYGASAKGSTLLNFFGLGKEMLDFVADRSTHKQGCLTPGTHLPIVPPGELVARMPDYTLLLTWNFADEILAQQSDYRDKGGKFIIPIPKVTVL